MRVESNFYSRSMYRIGSLPENNQGCPAAFPVDIDKQICMTQGKRGKEMENKILEEISRKYSIPIRQLNKLNKDKWYHGTTMDAYYNICEQGVISTYNIGTQLDFGTGFYLTDTIESASKYMDRLPDFNEKGEPVKRTEWCVIEFEFNPFHLLFETENTYTFCNFPKHNEDFAKFVFANRMYNVYNEKPHGYDIIWGVMSDSVPPEVLLSYQNNEITYEEAIGRLQKPQSMKQLYIGNQKICNMLKISDIIEIKKEEN